MTGAIDSPAIYELKGASESVREVLRYAGGAPVLADPNRAQLERIDPSKARARFVEEFRLDDEGLQKALRDGDVLTLLADLATVRQCGDAQGPCRAAVALRAQPGMRIRDLIPDREALISPDFYRRKNLLVQVIESEDEERMERVELPAKVETETRPLQGTVQERNERPPRLPNQARAQNGRDEDRNARNRAAAVRAKKNPAALFDELNWDYAVIERLIEKDLRRR